MQSYAIAFLLIFASIAGFHNPSHEPIVVDCERTYFQPNMTSNTNYANHECSTIHYENPNPNTQKQNNEMSAQQQKSENNASKQEKEELNTNYMMDS